MAAPISNLPAADTESKSAKKKKAKAAAAAAAAERTDSPAPTTTSDAAAEDAEHPYIRDIQKTLRNLNKKLSNVAKTEAHVAAHPDKSLNDLVAQKIINADQKAQLQSKPTLVSQVAQLDEQLSQFKKLQGEFKSKAQAERAEFEKSSTSGREKAVADALKEQEEKLTSQHDKELNDTLLHLSQFLRLAASRRSEECDPNSDENLAIEGVLLGVYTGDKSAVDCILKLARGTTDTTVSVNGEACQTTYAQLKDIAIEFNKPLAAPEAEPEAAETAATDPTVANATLTEIRAGDDTALTNGHPAEEASVETPANAEVANTTNAAGEKWDTGAKDLSTSQEWVNVPSNPEETESPVEVAPAAAANTQSWADDQPEPIAEAATPADPNDGFQSVPGRRGRDNRGGNYRGRGRGRGGPRGGAPRGGPRGGAPRGGPRRQEA